MARRSAITATLGTVGEDVFKVEQVAPGGGGFGFGFHHLTSRQAMSKSRPNIAMMQQAALISIDRRLPKPRSCCIF